MDDDAAMRLAWWVKHCVWCAGRAEDGGEVPAVAVVEQDRDVLTFTLSDGRVFSATFKAEGSA